MKRYQKRENGIEQSISSFKQKRDNLENKLRTMQQEDWRYHEEQKRLALLRESGQNV